MRITKAMQLQIHNELADVIRMSLWGEEKNLWASMLIQAIQDIQKRRSFYKEEFDKDTKKHNIATRENAKETAEAWVNDDREDVGSFIWVCWTLGLEPKRTRKAINAMQGGEWVRKLQFCEMGPLGRQEQSERGSKQSSLEAEL